MAAELRGYDQMHYQDDDGRATSDWPAGTQVGDLAVLFCQGGRRHRPVDTSGWVGVSGANYCTAWYRIVTSSDLAQPVTAYGTMQALQTFRYAAGIGRWREAPGLRVQRPGAGVLVFGEAYPPVSHISPDTGKLGSEVDEPGWAPNALWWLPGTQETYIGLSGATRNAEYEAWEIMPSLGPQAPTLLSPEPGALTDTDTATKFVWLHKSTAGQDQQQARVRVRAWTSGGTGTWYYVTAAGGMTTTVTALVQEGNSATLNSGQLSSGVMYEWQVSTYDSGVWGPFSGAQQFTPRTKPTVTSVTVTSPHGSLTPVVDWDYVLGAGTSAQAWQVRIVPATSATPDLPLWDSNIQTGEASDVVAPPTAGWVNGQNLYAWVRVMASGQLWSEWTRDDAMFSVSWTPPTVPTAVTPVNPAEVAGLTVPLQVTVTGIDTSSTRLELEASVDGTVWSNAAVVEFPSATEVIDLPAAEYGVAMWYRARATTLNSGVWFYSGWRTSASAVASTDTNAYFVTVDGSTSMRVDILEDSVREYVQGATVSYPYGSTEPRVDRTPVQGEAGKMMLSVASLQERASIVEWVTTTDRWAVRWYPEYTSDGCTLVSSGLTVISPASRTTLEKVEKTARYRVYTFEWVSQHI